MNFIPFTKFSIETKMPASEAFKVLERDVRPIGYVMPKEKRAKGLGRLFYRDLRSFRGFVDKRTFDLMQRFPTFSRSQPSIKGVFKPQETGTIIEVTVGSKFSAILFLVLSLCALVVSLLLCYQAFTQGKMDGLWSWGVFNIFLFPQLFIWMTFMLSFKWELRAIKKILDKIFEADNDA